MKRKSVFLLISSLIFLVLNGCIYNIGEEERPKTIKVKGKVMIDLDGINVGQPPVPATDIEDYFVIYSRMDVEQQISADIEGIEYVSRYAGESGKSKLPPEVKVFTDDETHEYYSGDGEFEIDVLVGTRTIWAGVPNGGYDVNFVDIDGLLEFGKVLDEIDGDDLEIILTPRKSGKAVLWVGPDDVNKLGKIASDFSEYYIRGAAVGAPGLDSPGILMNQMSENDGLWHNNGNANSNYWWFEMNNVPGSHKVGFNFGADPGNGYSYGLRGDVLSFAGEIGGVEILNEVKLVGKSTSEKYSPTISSISLSEGDHILKKAGTEFQIQAVVDANYISGGVKSVKADLSQLGLGIVVMTKGEESLYKTEILSLPNSLLSDKYVIEISAKDSDDVESTLTAEILVTSKPIIDTDTLIVTPNVGVIGEEAFISIEVPVADEVGEPITVVEATMPDGEVIELVDSGIRDDKEANDGIFSMLAAYPVIFYETGIYPIEIKAINTLDEETVYIYNYQVYEEAPIVAGNLMINFINCPVTDTSVYMHGELGAGADAGLEIVIDSEGKGSITISGDDISTANLTAWQSPAEDENGETYLDFKISMSNESSWWNESNLIGSTPAMDLANTVKTEGVAEIDLSILGDRDID